MSRFDQAARLDRLAERGRLTPRSSTTWQRRSPTSTTGPRRVRKDGGHAGMRTVIEGNAEDLANLAR